MTARKQSEETIPEGISELVGLLRDHGVRRYSRGGLELELFEPRPHPVQMPQPVEPDDEAMKKRAEQLLTWSSA